MDFQLVLTIMLINQVLTLQVGTGNEGHQDQEQHQDQVQLKLIHQIITLLQDFRLQNTQVMGHQVILSLIV